MIKTIIGTINNPDKKCYRVEEVSSRKSHKYNEIYSDRESLDWPLDAIWVNGNIYESTYDASDKLCVDHGTICRAVLSHRIHSNQLGRDIWCYKLTDMNDRRVWNYEDHMTCLD